MQYFEALFILKNTTALQSILLLIPGIFFFKRNIIVAPVDGCVMDSIYDTGTVTTAVSVPGHGTTVIPVLK